MTTQTSKPTQPVRVGERWRCAVCQRLYDTWVEATAHARQDLAGVSSRVPPPRR